VSAGQFQLRIAEGATLLNITIQQVAANGFTFLYTERRLVPTPGVHTYNTKILVSASNLTPTLYGDPTFPMSITAIEL
jgi:hypothetical protein